MLIAAFRRRPCTWAGAARRRDPRPVRGAAAITARWLIEPLSVTSPASIDGGVVEEDGAGDVAGAAGRLAASASSRSWNAARTAGWATTSRRSADRARQLPAGVEIGEDQRADEVAVEPGEHEVADQRRAGGDRAERAPPAMLTQVPVASLKSSVTRPSKTKPLREIAGVGEFQRVADPVIALVVEALGGLVGLLPVAGRHVRAPAAAAPASRRPAPA